MSNNVEHILVFESEKVVADKIELAEHLNYLFRTDAEQNWTNELTRLNVACMFDSKRGVVQFPSDLIERRSLRNRVSAFCKSVSQGDIRMMKAEYEEDNLFFFDDEMLGDVIALVQLMDETDGIIPLTLVTHCDQKQGYVHLHMLYINNTDKDLYQFLDESEG